MKVFIVMLAVFNGLFSIVLPFKPEDFRCAFFWIGMHICLAALGVIEAIERKEREGKKR